MTHESSAQPTPFPRGAHSQWQCLNTEQGAEDNPIQHAVRAALDALWETLEGDQPNNLYDLVIAQIERPLLETAMARCDQNQSRAAECLGINRSTLRKKLKQHHLLDSGESSIPR
ncbi:MAG: helix-turn-helix domain-containing protein [Halothiobacillus sp.]